MELFLLLAITYLLSLVLGHLLEKLHIPWLFSLLFLGMLLKLLNVGISNMQTFEWLATIGMYFMLFMIGFELEMEKLKTLGRFIILATFSIVLFDAVMGSIVIHSFGYSWIVAIVTALSFATVGEAILLPILDETKVLRTKLGSAIIGIGILDDVVEVFVIVVATLLIGKGMFEGNIFITISSLLAITFLLIILMKLKTLKRSLKKVPEMEDFFLLTLLLFFTFLVIGSYGNCEALASLLAGISLRTLLTKKPLRKIERAIRTFGYGFFAPLFFLWVGYCMDLLSIMTSPMLTLTVFFVSLMAKLSSSLLTGLKHGFSIKEAILLGTGLSVRFSTGLVITQLLYTNNLIDSMLFSSLIAASTLSTLFVPIIFSISLSKLKRSI